MNLLLLQLIGHLLPIVFHYLPTFGGSLIILAIYTLAVPLITGDTGLEALAILLEALALLAIAAFGMPLLTAVIVL